MKTQPLLPPMLGEFLSVEIQASIYFWGGIQVMTDPVI